MKREDRAEFDKIILELLTLYHRAGGIEELADENDLYFENLKDDFSLQDLRDCVHIIAKRCQFYPKIYDFYNALDELREKQEAENKAAYWCKQQEIITNTQTGGVQGANL